MTTTRFWWMRHAPVVDNGGRIYGGSEIDADVSNSATFACLAETLPKPAVFLTSALSRTSQTLAAVRAQGRMDIPESPLADARLNEQSLGDWHGQRINDIFPSGGPWPGFWMMPANNSAPNGESFTDLCARVVPAIHEIQAAHAGQDVVIAAHGGSIRAALRLALDITPEAALAFSIDNCSITRIDHLSGPENRRAWRVGRTNS
jgi:broad specificity phosphatase PhoE